ncbi:MAG: phosphoenolpyruvate--protein phosphotransferase [Bacteroidales bacterium]|nr:phosphoenolpyruvate--protein phosphotransferase [Bacteroidales bacterium]
MIVSGPAAIWHRAASGGTVRSFDEAFAVVRARLQAQAEDNPVFAAHLEMLEDPVLAESVRGNVFAGMDELAALDAARDTIISMFGQIDDEYLAARTDDVRDIFGQLRDTMTGSGVSSVFKPGKGSILVAEELFPSDMGDLDFSSLSGILCHKGSTTSHVCIIAHAKGLPIQVGVDVAGIRDGDIVSVDDPMMGGVPFISARVRTAGRKLYVNAGSVDEIKAGIAAGADGVGLFRTEFLFLKRDAMPSREEQRALYREALLACEGRPLVLRTLDVGGDKMLPYLPMPAEDNPFLGLRGVRFCLAHPELFRVQLSAVLDAARDVRKSHPLWYEAGPPLRLMLPMVCLAEEIRQVKEMLEDIDPDYTFLVRVGIMVETPSAALDAAALAVESAFFSIGTNDLTQYVMAADRGNPAVSGQYDPYAPAVLKAIALAVEAAHAYGIPAGICGELASDPKATDILLSMGLDSLSLSRL